MQGMDRAADIHEVNVVSSRRPQAEHSTWTHATREDVHETTRILDVLDYVLAHDSVVFAVQYPGISKLSGV